MLLNEESDLLLNISQANKSDSKKRKSDHEDESSSNKEKLTNKKRLRTSESKDKERRIVNKRRDTNENVNNGNKFSSLFKNNPEIPSIGNSQAKQTLNENLFSEKTFSTLDVHPHLIDCIEKRFNLSKMTLIQERCIPTIQNAHDCFVKSQTGSGKTLAYAIPIIHNLQAKVPLVKRNDGIFALVLVPTRELAIQTCQVFEKLTQPFVRIVAGALIGGMKKKSEKDRIRRGLNILIATPGRLCDHLDTTMALDLGKVEYLVFDEADRMLDMDFEKKINFIIFKLNERRKQLDAKRPQSILISATLSNGVKEIARRLNVVDAVSIDGPTVDTSGDHQNEQLIALPKSLSQFYVITPCKLRLIGLISFVLSKLVYSSGSSKMIIFMTTNDTVQLHEKLLNTFLNHKFSLYFDEDDLPTNQRTKSGVDVFGLYGNMEQHERASTLAKFIKSDSGVMICTDVAARGLDMPHVSWVIQYNTPFTLNEYVHRCGRCARAGELGKALIFLEPSEVEYIQELNKHGVSLKELKIDSIMKCLTEEANHYPRQLNSDRLVIAKTNEECANSMQFYIEEYVEKNPDVEELARKGFLSFVRAYSTYSREMKHIFHQKNLHMGHLAKSFGIRKSPNEIVDKQLNAKKLALDTKFNKTVNKKSSEKPYDKFQPTKSGYEGLLRKKKEVDENASGFDISQSFKIKNLKMLNTQFARKRLADRVPKSTGIKHHKDMSVFD